MTEEQNPYAAPQYDAPLLVSPDETDAERVRRAHLSHETSLSSWGGLYVVAGVCGAVVTFFMLGEWVARMLTLPGRGGGWQEGIVALVAMTAICGAISAAVLHTGLGMWRLNPKVKTQAVVLSVLVLLAFPCGTVVGAHMLYLLLSRKGRMILSPAYAEIRRQTPHIQYRTPLWNVILVGVILVLLAFLFLGSLL